LPVADRIPVPNRRAALDDDLQHLLDQEIAAADLNQLMASAPGAAQRIGTALEEGQRILATIVKFNDDTVFVALGGPDEGSVPLDQFSSPPVVGQQMEVMVRAYNGADGLYECLIPGQTVSVVDWSDLEEGSLVEAVVTAANSGGLECTVGAVRGFIPVSQISEYRVETPADFVGQRLACVITEANPRRKNLVLSRRAVLERERQERRQAQMAQLHVGDTVEGTVRTIKDFGAFVDLGGLEGLIHVSRLSWDRISNPSEVLEVGQKVKVRIEKIDEATGKLSLSYRDLLEHPWDNIEQKFPVGTNVKGTVSRLAEFGAFVKLAPGIEGLIHLSELAHHRVFKVDNHVKAGQEVEVKILSVDREQQRMSLSLRAVQPKPEPVQKSDAAEVQEEASEQRPLKVKPRQEPLRGGTGSSESVGERFGLKW
jgi:small subunit ribosomal protein S1